LTGSFPPRRSQGTAAHLSTPCPERN
jgi:hypothetical protein